MPIVDRLLFRELIGPLVFGAASFTTLLFAGSYLGRLTELLVQGVPADIVLRLFLLYLPGAVVLTLPMSVLLAVLLSFSRLSSDSEIIALQAGGISLWRLMRPVAVVAVAVTLLSYGINEWMAPQSQRQSVALRERALGETSAIERPFIISDLQEGSYNAIVIANGGLNPETRELRRVTILTGFTEEGPQAFFYAARAKWEGGSDWRLYKGTMKNLSAGRVNTVVFDEWTTQTVKINRSPDQIVEEQRKAAEMTFAELARQIARKKELNEETRSLEVDLYNKVAVPLASLVFAVIAAPLGLRPHRGGSAVGFGLSIGLIFAYWMVWQYSSALAKSGSISPLAGSFMANILFLAVGVYLMMRASR